MRLSVIYVNYNTTSLMLDSIKSLKKNLGIQHEIIVVDNNSSDFNGHARTEIERQALTIALNNNAGFGKANNIGVERSTGDYVWLLNTDTLIPPKNSMDELLSFLDDTPSYAAASPLLVNKSGEIQPGQTAYFPALWRLLLDKPAKIMGRMVPKLSRYLGFINTDFLPLRDRDVDMAVAASLVVKSSVYKKINGFDSLYFMYYEDMDLCRKLRAGDYKIRFMPKARVIHLWGKSIKSQAVRKQYYYSSQTRYFRKWHSRGMTLALRIIRLPIYIWYKSFGR